MEKTDKKPDFDGNDFKEKFEKAIESLKTGQHIMNFLDVSLDEINEAFEPMYNTAKKISKFLKKFQYVMQVFILAQKLAPYIKEMFGKKNSSYTI